MLDLEPLLEPTAVAPPCGPELGYDNEFTQIEKAATRVPPQEFGEHATEGQEPKWPDVLDLSKAFLARSKDLRVAVNLARALLHTEGAPGIAPGLALIRQLLARYWDAVHPMIESDGDSTMRLNTLAALYDTETFVADLRGAYLVNSRAHGQLKVRDVEIALGRLPPAAGSEAPKLEQIRAQIAASIAAGNVSGQAIAQALETIAAIKLLISEKAGAQHVPEFKPLTDVLVPVKKVFDEAAPQTTEVAMEMGDPISEDSSKTQQPLSGDIRSRQDAIRMLDRVCGYFERHEPTSPAPLLIRRAQRLMTKTFVEIVDDLLPDSRSALEKLAGKPESDSATPR